MLSQNLAPGPPVHEDQLEEHLEGFSVTLPTRTIDSLTDNLFATTKMDGVDPDIPFFNDTLTTQQVEDSEKHVILDGITLDSPKTHQENLGEYNNNAYFFLNGLLRKYVEHHAPVMTPRSKIQRIIWKCYDHTQDGHPGWKGTYRADFFSGRG